MGGKMARAGKIEFNVAHCRTQGGWLPFIANSIPVC
jgi:hypothetical protein